MYYYYHQHLQGILAAERWVTPEDLRRQPFSVLAVATHKEATELFSRVKLALGKEVGSYITVMKETTVKKTDSWPLKTQDDPTLTQTVERYHPKLLAYFFTSELGRFQLTDSSTLIPTIADGTLDLVETVMAENNVLDVLSASEDTSQLGSKLEHDQLILDFSQLHRNFDGKKEYTATKEDGKIILENASLSFDGYQLAQDIDQAAHLLDKIFHHIKDISNHYGDALRNIDAQITDELHYVEFADADIQHCVKSYKRLQELRVKRRCVKDSMLMANLLVRSMGMELPRKLSNVSEKINHLDQRTYMVRVPEEFQH